MDADLQSVELSAARVTDSHLVAVLVDGREIATPLHWYPCLSAATAEQRANFELSPFGIHWPDLDEDLSIEGMLAGQRSSQA